jgi:alpha-mannosidase
MKIHLIPNSHMDPVWLWNKYEGIDEVLNTFRSACDRLDEYPTLTFSASSVQFYDWIKKYDIALFDRIKKYISAGRWEVSGGWWVEPDTNLPLEVSFSKHAELSRKFMADNFNVDTTVAFVPDTFGHPATLPKILSETGFKYFIFCRPSMEENPDLPSNLFYWEYEGHKVLAYRLKNHYTQRGQIDITGDDEYQKANVNGYFFGIGNHGGGPSIVEIDYYEKLMKDNPKVNMGYSTCQKFFEDAEKNLKDIPTYSGDLHMHAVGCYSVLRNLKQKIRTSEHLLSKAERIVEHASRMSINKNWEKVLFNQFHDILPGSCSKNAELDADSQLGGVISECEDLIYDTLKIKSMNLPVKVKEGELRVYNSRPYDIKKPIHLEFSNISHERSEIFDSNGNKITKQEVLPEVRTLFTKKWEIVDKIPANSFNSYSFDIKVKKVDDDKQITYFNENKNSCKLLEKPVSFVVLEDNSDTWSHGLQKYENIKGHFEKQASSSGKGSISNKIYESYSFNNSSIDVIYSKYKELPGVYLDVNVNWAEYRSVLKMELDINTPKSWLTMQGAGGSIKRNANGIELPLHHWLWCPQDDNGFALIQDGAFACDYSKGKLRINLVRSSLYGFHDPYVINNINPQLHTDQGVHNFKFLLLPNYDYKVNELNKQTEIFLEDFVCITEGYK